ncbi:hypothetical protein KFK09_006706 [Dendrobium nobile]|uniref:RNase H type-1 domain-containing protein n=1 Tax=Dendrobium nobile TaxID=94219 RepID=A0A8T3BV72_DENNO|nr:hypothetical protein KFK09_006706 [Dendrobium nobile]
MCGPVNEGGLGCKSILDMVYAFSQKLWFAFRTNNSLWSNFMHIKYCKDVHPLYCSYKTSDSLVWKRLCKISWEAEQFVQWGLGKGDISFWQDNWLGNGSIDSMLNTHTLINTKVSSLLVNGNWNIIELGNLVPLELFNQIISIPLQLNAKDCIIFNISTNGQFKLNLVWDNFRVKQAESMVFKALWDNSIPVSYSILAWRCIKGFLPVDNRLWNKGFCLPSKCQCCFNIESIEHVFISSPIAQTVWNYFANSVNKVITLNGYDNLYALLSDWMTSTKGHIINILPNFILWFIWKARNEAKHRNSKINAMAIISNVNNKVFQSFFAKLIKEKDFKNCESFASALGIELNGTQVGRRERLVRWIKPIQFFLKLNTDGAVAQFSAGMGGILHDWLGEVILVFAGLINLCNAISAELMALAKGLELCLSRGFFNIEIEVDALLIVQLIKNEKSLNPQFFYLIRKIRMAMANINCSLNHILREGNACADWLANFGCTCSSNFDFQIDNLPYQLLALVSFDNLGLSVTEG